jgi:hypothetical protein
MSNIQVNLPGVDSSGLIVGGTVTAKVTLRGLPGPPGPPGPGIASNIARITASISPPDNPEVNDLWIDLN